VICGVCGARAVSYGGVIAIGVIALLIILACCGCLIRMCWKRRKDKQFKKGVKGAVDMKSVQMLTSAMKEKVRRVGVGGSSGLFCKNFNGAEESGYRPLFRQPLFRQNASEKAQLILTLTLTLTLALALAQTLTITLTLTVKQCTLILALTLTHCITHLEMSE